MDVKGFTGTVIGVVVAVVVTVSVLIPIIEDVDIASTFPNAGSIETLLEIIPLLVILSIVVIVVGAFMVRRT